MWVSTLGGQANGDECMLLASDVWLQRVFNRGCNANLLGGNVGAVHSHPHPHPHLHPHLHPYTLRGRASLTLTFASTLTRMHTLTLTFTLTSWLFVHNAASEMLPVTVFPTSCTDPSPCMCAACYLPPHGLLAALLSYLPCRLLRCGSCRQMTFCSLAPQIRHVLLLDSTVQEGMNQTPPQAEPSLSFPTFSLHRKSDHQNQSFSVLSTGDLAKAASADEVWAVVLVPTY